MNDDADDLDLFPDLDATGALRAAFKRRESPRSGDHAVADTLVTARTERQDYELQGEIARGGMGVIVKAFDRELTREVALKRLRDELAHEPRCVRRFLDEARVTARLDHPGIVPVHEVGRDARGRAYFAMRLVRGRDLSRIIELANAHREGWNPTRALSVFLKVCEAMAYAHEKGVIHRDLKPSNVMVGEFGEVYVMDWGLARVVGRDDAHELVLRDGPTDGKASDALVSRSRADLASPAFTMDGEVLGTPCYMSLEQAEGRIGEIGPLSDVYSVGAMLYHLLGNQMPFVPAGSSTPSRVVLAQLVQGPPPPLHTLRRDLAPELIAICERAMARDPADRYRGMSDMAEDLRAFLERRVVRAYETGAWAEARKWVRRNKPLAVSSAALVLALACGLIASLILRAQSDRNAKRAQDNAEVARQNEARAEANAKRALTSETLATERAADVFRLSARQDLDDLTAEADRLWPAQAEMVPRYEAWLARAQQQVDELPAHEKKLFELRAKAVPSTAAQAAEKRARHPRFVELQTSRGQLDYHTRLLAALDSTRADKDARAEDVGLDFASLPATAQALRELAQPLVDPERAVWGREPEGLILARRAVALAASLAPAERAPIRDTLAWALFANGHFDEAVIEEERALEAADPERRGELAKHLAALQASIDELLGPNGKEREKQNVDELAARVAEIEAEITIPPEWAFADTQDRWWHNQLEKLVDGLKAFADPATGLFSSGTSPEHGWGVKQRLAFAQAIDARSVRGPEAVARWSKARDSIRDASECPMYDGLAIAPQQGLLPIGRDPTSGMWEFAHLQTGEIAERDAAGKLVLRDETGLVFVLLPGGVIRLGAQRADADGPNYDPHALENEGPVHDVELAPFFLSKYEMTQAQWKRLTGRNPSVHNGAYAFANWSKTHRGWSGLHPVEQVSWLDCVETLDRATLVLPTESQWEYACRAGTSGPYSTGNAQESLQGAANLADAYGRANGNDSWPVWEAWLDDGETLHGDIGSYRANAYGLHDMHGNVFEWCKDRFGVFGKRFRAGDAENQVSGRNRVLRGGSFGSPAVLARSAFRFVCGPEYVNDNLGLRPARSLTR